MKSSEQKDEIKSGSISQKLLLLAVIPILVVSFLLGAYFVFTHINDVQKNLTRKGNLIAGNLSPSAEFGLFSNDVKFLRSLSEPLLTDKDVVSILILDKNRSSVTASISPEFNASQLLADERKISVFESPVYSSRFNFAELAEGEQLENGSVHSSESELLGWVVVKLSKSSSAQHQNEIIINALLFVFLGVVISGLIAYRMSKRLARPILELTNTVDDISSGNLSSRCKTNATGELQLLQQGVNSMAEIIQGAHQKLESQVARATHELTKTIVELEEKNTSLSLVQADLIEANAAKSEFLAKMSHEIRTPLTAVMGFSRLIENAKSKDDIKAYTRVINRSGVQLLNVIDDILSFSKLENESADTVIEDVNVRDALDDAISMLAPAAKLKQLSLLIQVSNEIPLYLKTDAFKFSQIIINLVNNAIKFTENGHVLINASLIDSYDEEVVLEFEVIDTGIGVVVDDSEKIFGSFLQAESKKNRSFEGTGLGLAISKKLVDLLGGNIGVDTSVKSGARFWFNIPMSLTDNLKSIETLPPLENTVILYDKVEVSSRIISKLLLFWKADLYICENTNKILELASSTNVTANSIVVSLNFEESSESYVASLLQSIRNRFSGNIVILVSHMSDQIREKLADFSLTKVQILEKPVPQQRLYQALSESENPGDTETIDRNQLSNSTKDGFLSKDANKYSNKDANKDADDNLVEAQIGESQQNDPQSNYFNIDKSLDKPKSKAARILVAEDNEFNSILIGELFSERGIDCVRVVDADAVLQSLEHEKYDLLLLDIHMPGMDGLTLASEIRKYHYISRETPIIAFTADVYVRNSAQLQEKGVNDVLYKPFTDELLDKMLERWLPDFDFSVTDDALFVKSLLDGSNLDESISSDMSQRLLDDVLVHLKNIEMSYSFNNDVAMNMHIHQLEGMLGYFQYDKLLAELKTLKLCGLSRHDDEFHRTLSLLTELVKAAYVNKELINTN